MEEGLYAPQAIESPLRSFQYKILNNILYLKIVDSPLCFLCKTENESMLHLFCECAVASNLLEQFKLWVSDIFLLGKIDIDPKTIIFGAWRNLNTPDFIPINHMILLFKRYIYLRRQDRHGPNITGLKSFIKNIDVMLHVFTEGCPPPKPNHHSFENGKSNIDKLYIVGERIHQRLRFQLHIWNIFLFLGFVSNSCKMTEIWTIFRCMKNS